jgi:hypothetical protein
MDEELEYIHSYNKNYSIKQEYNHILTKNEHTAKIGQQSTPFSI